LQLGRGGRGAFIGEADLSSHSDGGRLLDFKAEI